MHTIWNDLSYIKSYVAKSSTVTWNWRVSRLILTFLPSHCSGASPPLISASATTSVLWSLVLTGNRHILPSTAPLQTPYFKHLVTMWLLTWRGEKRKKLSKTFTGAHQSIITIKSGPILAGLSLLCDGFWGPKRKHRGRFPKQPFIGVQAVDQKALRLEGGGGGTKTPKHRIQHSRVPIP